VPGHGSDGTSLPADLLGSIEAWASGQDGGEHGVHEQVLERDDDHSQPRSQTVYKESDNDNDNDDGDGHHGIITPPPPPPEDDWEPQMALSPAVGASARAEADPIQLTGEHVIVHGQMSPLGRGRS